MELHVQLPVQKMSMSTIRQSSYSTQRVMRTRWSQDAVLAGLRGLIQQSFRKVRMCPALACPRQATNAATL